MAKFISVYEKKADLFSDEFDNLDDAILAASYFWNHLSSHDQKFYNVYVLESCNPDPDSFNHFDGFVKFVVE